VAKSTRISRESVYWSFTQNHINVSSSDNFAVFNEWDSHLNMPSSYARSETSDPVWRSAYRGEHR
jgi:hypothetical protein